MMKIKYYYYIIVVLVLGVLVGLHSAIQLKLLWHKCLGPRHVLL